MKALSIQQPWGSLICCGLKDVENRSWALKSTPLRILIHTGAKRSKLDESTMPYVWLMPIENAQTMGILGKLGDLPTSSIIGVATIDRCDAENFSKWAQDGHGAEYKWVLRDVKLFKQPITGVKGKLGLFDVPGIDENNLPECVSIPQIERNGKLLRIPLCREYYDLLQSRKETAITFNLVDENLALFATKSLKPKPTEKVTFFCGDDCFDADVADYSTYFVKDSETDEDIIYTDAFECEYSMAAVTITID